MPVQRLEQVECLVLLANHDVSPGEVALNLGAAAGSIAGLRQRQRSLALPNASAIRPM